MARAEAIRCQAAIDLARTDDQQFALDHGRSRKRHYANSSQSANSALSRSRPWISPPSARSRGQGGRHGAGDLPEVRGGVLGC
jgi:hypothetical protein